jgi:hypothetical protein
MPAALRSLLGALLLLSFSASAQTFYRQFGLSGIDETGSALIKSPDGNVIVGGSKADSALLMKVDPLGNIIWMKCFKPSPTYGNHVYGLAISPDNYIIGVGNAHNTYERLGFCFKFDLNGNCIWTSTSVVSGSYDIFYTRIIPKSATEYLICASSYELGNTWNDQFSVRVNGTTGNLITNSARINYIPANSYIDDAYGAAMGRNACYYTIGRTYVNGANADGMRPYVTKFDNTGNYLWSKFLLYSSSASARIYGTDIYYENDTLVMCYFGDRFGSSTNFTVGIIKADTLGNVIFSKDYDITTSSQEQACNIRPFAGGYAITGFMVAGSNDLFVIKIDHNGNLQWAKSFGGANNENLFRVICQSAVSDNNFLYFTGRVYNGTYTDMVLAKVDPNGISTCAPSNTIPVVQSNNPTNSTSCSPTYPPNIISMNTPSQAVSRPPIADLCSSYNVNLGNDTTMCSGSLLLNGTTSGATSYLWQNGSTASTFTATSPGTYWVIVTANCCLTSDTIVIQSAVVTHTQSLGICTGDSVQVGSNYYSSAGTYTDTLTSQSGCDSVVVTNLTVGGIFVAQAFAICPGDSVQVGSSYYTSAGTYSDTLASQSGCDSVVTTTVSMNVYSFSQNAGICSGDSVQVGSNYYSSPGTYVDTLVSQGGCDSVVTTTVSLNIAYSSQSFVICQGSSVTVGNNVYTQSGTYQDTLVSQVGCDSIVTTNLTVNSLPVIAVSGSTSICQGQSATLTASGASTYTWSPATGLNTTTGSSVVATPPSTIVYTVTGTSTAGCVDSVTVLVNVLPAPSLDMGIGGSICFGDTTFLLAGGAMTYSWSPSNSLSNSTVQNPFAYPTVTTTYTCVGTALNGCTAMGTETVVVNPLPPTPTITANGTILASSSAAGYQWYLNGNIISGATSQFYTVTQNGFYQVVITDANGCTATSAPFNFSNMGTGGYDDLFTSFTVFPNPAGDFVTVSINDKGKGSIRLDYSLLDCLGREVLQGTLRETEHTLDLTGFSPGTYLFKVTDSGKVVGICRLVISR